MLGVAFCSTLMLMTAAFAGATTAGPAAKSGSTSSPDTYAQATSSADTLLPLPVTEPPLVGVSDPVPTATRIRVGPYTFTTDKMSETYDQVYVGSLEYLTVTKGFGMGFEVGWTSATGTPPLVDSDWEVTDSWVKMSALLLEVNIHYNLLDDTGSELFGPYAAVGPAMWVGSERIAAEATRAPVGIESGFYAEQLALGLSFGASAMIGTTVRIKGDYKALIEARYVVSSSGAMLDLVPEEEDNDRLDATLYSAVQRPGFDFTGWQITVGFQW